MNKVTMDEAVEAAARAVAKMFNNETLPPAESTKAIVKTAIEAALPHLVPDKGEVGVKALPTELDWQHGEARSAAGDLYTVHRLSEIVFTTCKNGTAFPGWKSTLEGAKAVAQADYARIRSALYLKPEVGAEPVEWRYLLHGKGAWKHAYSQSAADALYAENKTVPAKRRHVIEPLYLKPLPPERGSEEVEAHDKAIYDAGWEAGKKYVQLRPHEFDLAALASPPLSQPRAEVIGPTPEEARNEIARREDAGHDARVPLTSKWSRISYTDLLRIAALSSTSGATAISDAIETLRFNATHLVAEEELGDALHTLDCARDVMRDVADKLEGVK